MRSPIRFVAVGVALYLMGCGRSENSSPLGDPGASRAERYGNGVETSPRFDLANVEASPFPSDHFTIVDDDQVTGQRVALPKPDCARQSSTCDDIDVLNALDGFNLQARLSIPFNGGIDPSSVTSDTVFLIQLDAGRDGHGGAKGDSEGDERRGAHRIGINQIVWDPESQTLHAESDETLLQSTRYALIVTTGVRDSSGTPIVVSGEFERFRSDLHGEHHRYKKALLDALDAARHLGVAEKEVAAASVFTAQSITPAMERLRDYLRSLPAPQADFHLVQRESGERLRTTFPIASIRTIDFNQHIGASPPGFRTVKIGLPDLNFVPGAVGSIAYGRVLAPVFLQSNVTFGPVGTNAGVPPVVGSEQVYFNVYLPAGGKPAGGWPVAVIGLGGNRDKEAFPTLLAAKLAEAGIASVAINPVGRGFGPLSTNTITLVDGSRVTFLAGGRGSDSNQDNVIESSEGADAVAPYQLIGSRDSTKQTILDYIQLVRAVEAGMDVDGDGSIDLDRNRIHFIGWSFGANYGVPLVALDPAFKASVFNAVGGPLVDNRRLGVNRSLVVAALAARVPSLLNLGTSFDENLPLRDQPPVVNHVQGAIPIQEYIDRNEWAQQSADVVPYAIHLQSRPITPTGAKPSLILIAKGDQTVPNPAASAVIRAGNLDAQTTFYRHDLASAADPLLLKNPHQCLTLIRDPRFVAISRAAQEHVAKFLASEGLIVTQPEPVKYFEVPITGPLPEALNFVP
jgi:hypothetical protein